MSKKDNARQGHEKDAEMEPFVDEFETPDGISLLVDMPGVEPDEVAVRFGKDTVAVFGLMRDNGHSPRVRYYKSIALGARIDPATARVEMKHGVLSIHALKASPLKRLWEPVPAAS